jgi:threonine/homoserine/homoserine lactone efflux protein
MWQPAAQTTPEPAETDMTPAAYLAYATALAIAAAIPGPGIAALVGRALGTGFWRTLPMLTGLVLGDLTYLLLAVAGLAVIAKTFAGVFVAVKFAGAFYLAWLAFKFWKSGIAVTEARVESGHRDAFASFMAGLALTLGNPKTIVFYLAITPAVIDLHTVDAGAFGILALATIAVLYAVLVPYIALAARARMALRNPKALRFLNRGAAIAMAGAAGWVIARA